MFDPENEPRNAPKKPKLLDNMSIEELQRYIQDMKDEILRVEKEIVKKKAHKDAAASIFKS